MTPPGTFPTALDSTETWAYKGCALNVAKRPWEGRLGVTLTRQGLFPWKAAALKGP